VLISRKKQKMKRMQIKTSENMLAALLNLTILLHEEGRVWNMANRLFH
jgi:hypothetical protein